MKASSKDTKAKKDDSEKEGKELDRAAANVAVAPEATAEKDDVSAIKLNDQKNEYVINYSIAKKIMKDMSDDLKEV